MLQTQAVSGKLLELLIALQQLPAFQSLRLVGGTALALQIGHRESVDIDLFGELSIDKIQLFDILTKFERVKLIGGSESIHIYFINDIKTDIVNYPFPWLEKPIYEKGLCLAGKQDIAAMKIAAITQRGSKKDFIDLYYLLNDFLLSEILHFYELNFADANTWLAIRSLSYFEDAENQPMPKMLKPITWPKIKTRIKSELLSL